MESPLCRRGVEQPPSFAGTWTFLLARTSSRSKCWRGLYRRFDFDQFDECWSAEIEEPDSNRAAVVIMVQERFPSRAAWPLSCVAFRRIPPGPQWSIAANQM